MRSMATTGRRRPLCLQDATVGFGRCGRLLAVLVAALVVFVATAMPIRAASTRPRVYIVLIDGLDSRRFNETLTPTLWKLAAAPGGRGAFYPRGQAVMPTVTNTNHVSIATGTYAEAHGVVNNAFWSETRPRTITRSERAELIQVETVFSVAERKRAALKTAMLFGKSRLIPLFAGTAQQTAPDVLWGDPETATEPIDKNRGFASDRRTMDETLQVVARDQPDLMFVGLPDVDRTSHIFGPDSHRAKAALLEADRQVGRLVSALKRSGAWDETVLMVTADHGFADVSPNAAAGRPYPMITLGAMLKRQGLEGIGLLGVGGLESVVVLGAGAELTLDEQMLLAEVRRHALEHPGVQAAWYRSDNPQDGDDAYTLAKARARWRLDHPRAGHLILVGKPGYHFVDPFRPWAASMVGMHGGPDVQDVPIIVTGGHPRLRAERAALATDVPPAANPDLGATAAWLLDLPVPRTLSGKRVPDSARGRVLREAFVD